MLRCKLWAILADWYIAFIEYFVLHKTFPTKESVVMAIMHAIFTLLFVVADENFFFS